MSGAHISISINPYPSRGDIESYKDKNKRTMWKCCLIKEKDVSNEDVIFTFYPATILGKALEALKGHNKRPGLIARAR